MPFFIIFVLIPLAEIMVFIKVSQYIGLGTALLMALCTAILGGYLVRQQGIAMLFSAKSTLDNGKLPSQEIFEGLCIVAAGALLITPGFISDTLGFLLLIPVLRTKLLEKLIASNKFTVSGFSQFDEAGTYKRPQDPNVIDVDYETIEIVQKDEKL